MGNTVRNSSLVGVLAVGLVVVFGMVSNSGHYQDYQENKSLDAANAKTLEVSSSDVNVHVHPGSGDKITANFSGRGEKGAYQLVTDVQGDRVHVGVERIRSHGGYFLFNWDTGKLDLDVAVPQRVFDQLNVQTSSGNTDIQSIQASEAVVQVNSGNLSLNSLQSNTLKVNSHSGNVDLADVQANTTIRSQSGDIRINTLKGNHHDLNSNSGNIKLEQVDGNVHAQGDSGNITVSMNDANSQLDLGTHSGNVTAYLPANANFQTDLSVDSGNVKVGFPAQWTMDDEHHKVGTVGSGGPQVKVTTNSGNIELAQR